jgi:hypothetical protein
MTTTGTKPWFDLQKLGFFALKPKTQCIGRAKVGLVVFPPLVWEEQ